MKKPLINKGKMNKKEFKVCESIPTLLSFLILFPYAVSFVSFPMFIPIYYSYVYCICRVVGKVEKPLILNGFSVFEVRIAASLFKRMSFVIWLLFLLRFYHRKVCSEYAVTKCRTCSNYCVKMSHKQ